MYISICMNTNDRMHAVFQLEAAMFVFRWMACIQLLKVLYD